jgi:hypothetical protein
MKYLLFIFLLQIPQRPVPYHPLEIDAVPRRKFTYIEIRGIVTTVRIHEKDGDTHFRVADLHGHDIVCEIVPSIPLEIPKVGNRVIVQGMRHFDDWHKWWEIHPVESWSIYESRGERPAQ